MSRELQSANYIRFIPRQTKVCKKTENKPKRAGTIPSSSFVAKAKPSSPPSKPVLVRVAETFISLTPLGGGTGCNPGTNGKELDAGTPQDARLDGQKPADQSYEGKDGLFWDVPDYLLPDVGPKEGGTDLPKDQGPPDVKKDIVPPKDQAPDKPPLDQGIDKFVPNPDIGPDKFVKPDQGVVCNKPGTPIQHKTFSGKKTSVENWSVPEYLIPQRNWTYCWQATSGKLPGLPFKLKDTSGKGGNPVIVTDTTGEKAMKMDSLTKNLNGLYQYEWHKPTGLGTTWSFQARLRLGKTESNPSQGEASILGYDNQYGFILLFSPNRVDEFLSKKSTPLTTTLKSTTLRGEINNGNFKVYSNEISQILTGNLATKGGSDPNFIIGDVDGPKDGITYINSFCFEPKTSIPGITAPPKYEASITLPKLGTKAKIKMIGTNSNATIKAQTSVDGKNWSTLKSVTAGLEIVSSQPTYKHVKVVAELSSTKPSRLGTFSLEWTQCN